MKSHFFPTQLKRSFQGINTVNIGELPCKISSVLPKISSGSIIGASKLGIEFVGELSNNDGLEILSGFQHLQVIGLTSRIVFLPVCKGIRAKRHFPRPNELKVKVRMWL